MCACTGQGQTHNQGQDHDPIHQDQDRVTLNRPNRQGRLKNHILQGQGRQSLQDQDLTRQGHEILHAQGQDLTVDLKDQDLERDQIFHQGRQCAVGDFTLSFFSCLFSEKMFYTRIMYCVPFFL